GTNNTGVFFRVTRTGKLTGLASFGSNNGGQPFTLVEGKEGIFYGTTAVGVLQVTSSGRLTTLIAYDINNLGSPNPSTVVQGADGNLYGAACCGRAGPGEIFKIAPVSYTGLFYRTNGLAQESSGLFSLSVAIDWSFTGKLKFGT